MKKKGGKKALAVILTLVLLVAAGGGIWQICVRAQSKKYNLTTLDTSSLPEPLSAPLLESDVQLSEVKMHFVRYGEGEKTVILIHGNANSHKTIEEIATYLGNYYTVYVPDSRCHGDSTDPGVISYKLMAKDIYEFCEALKIEKPYIMGHSDGGIVALTFASMYPDKPAGIISCGANSKPETFKPYFTVAVKISNLFHPDKLNDMMLTLPDFTDEDFAKITAPTYIVAGEYDIMWLSDSVYMHNMIKDSRIQIIKSASHCTYMSTDGRQGFALAMKCIEDFEKN